MSKTHPKPLDRITALGQLGLKCSAGFPADTADGINAVEQLIQVVLEKINNQNSALKIYGSVYLSGFDVGRLRDRIDF